MFIGFIVPVILVILSFSLSGFKGLIFQIILLGVSCIVPDGIPVIDEVLMGFATFRNFSGLIKAIKVANALNKIKECLTRIKIRRLILFLIIVAVLLSLWFYFLNEKAGQTDSKKSDTTCQPAAYTCAWKI
jgi:hypothetical protein